MSLFEHQQQAKAHLIKWKVGALFMEAGTGKTRVACELVSAVAGLDLILWIGPLGTLRTRGALPSVPDEIAKWGSLPCETLFMGVESIGASDRIYLEVVNKLKQAKKAFIVVDESLKIKNIEAKRTKRLLALSELAEYKLILNGTPISKNLLDMWAQMQFLSPKILQMNYARFKNTFCKYTQITKHFGGRTAYTREFITGYENIDYLYFLIRHYVYECDLSMQVKQLYTVTRYQVDDNCREAYKNIKERFLSDETLEWKNNNIFLEMTQKMQHAYCCTENKFLALEGLFKSIPQSGTIIYCKYIDSRVECEKRFPKATVLSYQREALGLNLQNYHYTVYFDKIWDLALRLQAGRRTFRTGQLHNCHYYDLTGDVELESLIDRNIQKKVDMLEYLKGKTKEELKKEL